MELKEPGESLVEEFERLEERKEELSKLNREQRNEIEPVENAINYTVDALTSEDTYFDPIHAARLRAGEENSEPISEIVDLDFRELSSLEDGLVTEFMPEKSREIPRNHHELIEHFEQGNLIDEYFSTEVEDLNIYLDELRENDTNEFKKAVNNVRDGKEKSVREKEFSWGQQAAATLLPYIHLLGGLLYSTSSNSPAWEHEEVPDGDDIEKTLYAIGFKEFLEDYILPEQPLEEGYKMLEQLLSEYDRKLDNLEGPRDQRNQDKYNGNSSEFSIEDLDGDYDEWETSVIKSISRVMDERDEVNFEDLRNGYHMAWRSEVLGESNPGKNMELSGSELGKASELRKSFESYIRNDSNTGKGYGTKYELEELLFSAREITPSA